MIKIYIYSLTDPITNQIRYIGKSIDPQQRYYAHISRCKERRTHTNCWIYGLSSKNLKPILNIIEECNELNWVEREQHHISLHENLTNLTIGGEGTHGLKASDEAKLKMSNARKGIKNHFYGKKHTPETLKKMSEILKTKDCRQKTTNKGKKFPEAGPKISAARKEYYKTNPHPMLGVKRTTEMRLNNSLSALNQQKHKCVYCDVVTIAGNIKRWHNDNCKDKG